jgi:uncharacterized protein (UPF0332 family)
MGGDLMDAREFLTVADKLVAGTTEADWRTAASRLYYATFHVARDLLRELGFVVPRADRAHSYVNLRLANCGHAQTAWAGTYLSNLRQARNEADYDLGRRCDQSFVLGLAPVARQVIQVLDAARAEPTRTQITDAMKVYERDVLRDTTWRP